MASKVHVRNVVADTSISAQLLESGSNALPIDLGATPRVDLLKAYYFPLFKDPATISAVDISNTKIAPYDLRDAQEALWGKYLRGDLQWATMIDQARLQESKRRAALMKEWNIKPEGYVPGAGENVVFRTGTDPSVLPGRGEFSDEDLTANTQAAWEHLRTDAVKRGWEVVDDEDAGFFRMPALNTIVWKPKDPAPALSDTRSFVPHLIAISTHPEVVDPSSAKPKFAMEYILAMVNKGQVGFSKPVEKWGKGYERYETLIQMAKATHHAMEKSGLSLKEPEKFNRLWDLCKMKKSPEELRMFKPKASEAEIIAGLKKEQAEMQKLLTQSFAAANEQLEKKMDQLAEDIEQHSSQCTTPELHHQDPNADALVKEAKETHERLDKVFHQLMIQVASKDHAKFIQKLFSGDAGDQKRYLKSYATFSNKLENWTRGLSAFLEAEWFAGQTAPQGQGGRSLHPKWEEPLRNT